MIESFFLTVNEWMAGGTAITAMGCFAWGMISVLFSPCHLASIPLIIAYVGGQHRALTPKQAGSYAALFTLGLFITITVIGIVCTLLGRMLGDVGNYWQILIGLLLVWVALGMLGVEKCTMSGSLVYRLNLKGLFGAFALGLAYGILSGSCTFGFIAPILAIITVQQKMVSGILFIVLFAVGHCLPIVIAGSSTAAVRRLMENSTWQNAGNWFRKGAGVCIGLLGIYFIVNTWVVL
ncbi:MAG: sulfite exporter TauE/SafE family protein [Deltaproteobacteria bacterium]|jgi:cytochrome c-type biogenesis protein|nr:sulfite exporter TauE/SafE family protein [Deltaproteobacteria bacterium]MBW1748543.1 sulfite exporter TauE/SafE family protein [Deltaproteobacteria bacterium]MBW1827624.1 sulfite exporter TauE/SafE family protein [Deltaproteobacteria bacterium]MBW2155903.1 sulfite exporter TauE/SafE family protein [Deltaproteobacteria bacterium]MBW2196430.1 sulfite exporter TauE/SafE family protein [Deltaproteobacteria bacterium]